MGPDDKHSDTLNTTNQLGEIQFSTFHTEQGFHILIHMINTSDERLDSIIIKDSQNIHYTITEFLDYIQPYTIR